MALSRREFVRRIGAGGAGVAAASGIIGYGREEELFAFVQGEDSAADGRQWAVRPDSSQQQRESEGPEPQGHRGVEGASLEISVLVIHRRTFRGLSKRARRWTEEAE